MIDLHCSLYDITEVGNVPPPKFSALVYDTDTFGMKDLLGRIRVDMFEDGAQEDVHV